MSDRLAEIEATRKKVLSEYEFSRADDDMLMLLTSGIPWLLARVRELEAQAELMVDVYKGADLPELVARVNAAEARVRELEAQAVRDAKVIEAARAYRIAQRAIASACSPPFDPGVCTDAMVAQDEAEATLDAALAAREE